jgi:hypothetical protein
MEKGQSGYQTKTLKIERTTRNATQTPWYGRQRITNRQSPLFVYAHIP